MNMTGNERKMKREKRKKQDRNRRLGTGVLVRMPVPDTPYMLASKTASSA
jgi:hypothetical protein